MKNIWFFAIDTLTSVRSTTPPRTASICWSIQRCCKVLAPGRPFPNMIWPRSANRPLNSRRPRKSSARRIVSRHHTNRRRRSCITRTWISKSTVTALMNTKRPWWPWDVNVAVSLTMAQWLRPLKSWHQKCHRYRNHRKTIRILMCNRNVPSSTVAAVRPFAMKPMTKRMSLPRCQRCAQWPVQRIHEHSTSKLAWKRPPRNSIGSHRKRRPTKSYRHRRKRNRKRWVVFCFNCEFYCPFAMIRRSRPTSITCRSRNSKAISFVSHSIGCDEFGKNANM